MRQPTFSRRRQTRQQRLLRTGIGIVVVVAVAALAANLVGGDEATRSPQSQQSPDRPQVEFRGTFVGETDADDPPKRSDVRAQGREIVKLLDDWYQQAFVDPARFGKGTFPDVAKLFASEARAAFVKDIKVFTIGDARTEVARVEPQRSTARVTIYFERGRVPRFATADVSFRARATLKDPPGGLPLRITQDAVLTLKRTSSGGWFVVFYEAEAAQRSIRPSPSPSPSPTPSP